MAHIETWYRCPICKQAYSHERGAVICRNKHPVISERRAIGKGGKSVRINRPGQEAWALREADLSDFIEERKEQLKEIRKEECLCGMQKVNSVHPVAVPTVK